MTASRADIKGWLEEGLKRNARWVIIGLDRFDYENYPIYVDDEEEFWDRIKHIGDNGSPGMGDTYDEVYDLSMDIDEQLAVRGRVMNMPYPRAQS